MILYAFNTRSDYRQRGFQGDRCRYLGSFFDNSVGVLDANSWRIYGFDSRSERRWQHPLLRLLRFAASCISDRQGFKGSRRRRGSIASQRIGAGHDGQSERTATTYAACSHALVRA